MQQKDMLYTKYFITKTDQMLCVSTFMPVLEQFSEPYFKCGN